MFNFWPFHSHNWVEVERQYGETTFLSSLVTVITSRCSTCRKYKQENLNGYIRG